MAQTFTLDASGSARRFLKKTAKRLKDFRPALKDVEAVQLKEIKKQFTTQGTALVGGKWKKRKGKGSWPILNKTGKLKKSFKKSKLTKTELDVTSKIPYFKYHQLGTKKMPKRQILGWSSGLITKTTNILMKYIIKR